MLSLLLWLRALVLVVRKCGFHVFLKLGAVLVVRASPEIQRKRGSEESSIAFNRKARNTDEREEEQSNFRARADPDRSASQQPPVKVGRAWPSAMEGRRVPQHRRSQRFRAHTCE